MRLPFGVGPLLSILLACCGRQQDTTSALDAQVSAEQFKRAHEIVGGIDYLPFDYTRDGCYARALYMAMELAHEKIPSSSVYAFEVNEPLRVPDGHGGWESFGWTFHVAPMIKIGSDGRDTIIDPSLSKAQITIRDWIRIMGDVNPKIVIKQGSVYFREEPRASDPELISEFASMRAFNLSAIDESCDFAHDYIAEEDSGNTREKQARLIGATRRLLRSLYKLDKIKLNQGYTAINCRGVVIPVE